MSGTPSIESVGRAGDAVPRKVDRVALAVGRALAEHRREAAAMARLLEAADVSGKGRHVDYEA